MFGIVAGWLAGPITKADGYGVKGDIITGLVGAVIGAYVFGSLGIASYGRTGPFMTALAGAIIVISVVRLIKRA